MKREIEQSLEEQHSMEKQLEEQQEQLEQLGQLVGVSSSWRGPGCRWADGC